MAAHSVSLPGKSHGRRSLVQATVHGVAKSWTQLSDFTFIFFHFLGEKYGQKQTWFKWVYLVPFTVSWWLRCNAGDPGLFLQLGKAPGEGSGYSHQDLLPVELQQQCSLVGYSPWGCKESDTTEQLTLPHVVVYMLDRVQLFCKPMDCPPPGSSDWVVCFYIELHELFVKFGG